MSVPLVAVLNMLSRFTLLIQLLCRHPVSGRVILRASQPLVGVLSWRSPEDEKLLQAVSQACWQSRPAPVTTPYQTEIHQNGRYAIVIVVYECADPLPYDHLY